MSGVWKCDILLQFVRGAVTGGTGGECRSSTESTQFCKSDVEWDNTHFSDGVGGFVLKMSSDGNIHLKPSRVQQLAKI